jgi:hypothetical protein
MESVQHYQLWRSPKNRFLWQELTPFALDAQLHLPSSSHLHYVAVKRSLAAALYYLLYMNSLHLALPCSAFQAPSVILAVVLSIARNKSESALMSVVHLHLAASMIAQSHAPT